MDFDYLDITLMVAIVDLTGLINITSLFPLLDLTRIYQPISDKKKKRIKSKIKIPYVGYAGAIPSARLGPVTHGIWSSKKKKGFRNTILLYISTKTKNVSCKLSKNSIQMTGLTSKEMAVETANEIIKNIEKVKNFANWITENREKAEEISEFVKDSTCGESVLLIDDTNIIANPNRIQTDVGVVGGGIAGGENEGSTELFVTDDETDERLPVISTNTIVVPSLDFDFGSKEANDFALYLLRMVFDYTRHDMYCLQVDFVLSTPNIITFESPNSNIEIKKIRTSMVNYNYDLGFNINREALYSYIEKYRPYGFEAKYHSTLDNYVTINLWNDPNLAQYQHLIRRKKDKPNHSIIVYEKGHITQSGPCEDMIKHIYVKFNALISKIAPLISLTSTKIREIKIHPQSYWINLEKKAQNRKRLRGEVVEDEVEIDPILSSKSRLSEEEEFCDPSNSEILKFQKLEIQKSETLHENQKSQNSNPRISKLGNFKNQNLKFVNSEILKLENLKFGVPILILNPIENKENAKEKLKPTMKQRMLNF